MVMPKQGYQIRNIFRFEELSDKAKQRAINDGAIAESDMGLTSERLHEMFVSRLEEEGLPTDDIRFSLSHSQGDGVAFYGNVDLEAFLTKQKVKGKFRNLLNAIKDGNIEVVISKSQSFHLYDHWNTMVVMHEWFGDLTTAQVLAVDNIPAFVRERIIVVSKELTQSGYAEIDYVNSEDYFKENAEANEWVFYTNGKLAGRADKFTYPNRRGR